VIAKAPAPGRAKTRLTPPLTADEAAALHEALLRDTLAACRAAVPDTRILHADPRESDALAELAGPGTPLVLQQGRGLAAALRSTMASYLPDGPVAVVSSDVPGLPPGALERAFRALEHGADVVLGPALDGGYWLIAMRVFHDAPFRRIPWSTPAVLGVTLARCREAGLHVELLERWRDVDTMVDVAWLAREAKTLPAPQTRKVLRRLAIPSPPAVRFTGSRLLAGSPWRAILDDRLETDEGRETGYSYLAVPRAVFVVAVTDEEDVLLVRQYRHPVRDWTLEVPAGSVHDGETPLEAAARELAEEAGGRARNWRHLTTFYSSSAHLSLRSDVFLATGVEVGDAAPDTDERLELVRLPLAEALERAAAGAFAEGQTALAILLAAPHLNGRRA
jgi:rSAM/selenodomain-associated transferase 1